MKKSLWILPLLAILACGKSKQSTSPIRKDLTQAVYASGKLYPLNRYMVLSKVPGYVQKVFVKVGDIVTVGQPLMAIRNDVSDINVSTARNNLSLAQQNAEERSGLLIALKNDAAAAKAKLRLDSMNNARFERLMEANATSKQALDQARTQYDVSRQNYNKALSNLQNTRDKLQIELKNAQNQVSAQLTNKNDYVIYSAIRGKVYDVNVKEEGELINAQTVLMELGDATDFEVELQVDETDIALVQPGQDVVYTADVYKDKTFKGKVKEAYPRVSAGNRTAKVIASLELGASVYSGMSIEANIIIAKKKNILVIPREYVIDGNKVKLKATKELVEIRKGVEDLEFVEVLSGIDEKTEIVKQ
jgi:multidrug resistance efflux pump